MTNPSSHFSRRYKQPTVVNAMSFSTEAEHVRVRLEWITTHARAHFHVDRIPYRLLCTYRGLRTEWISNKTAADLKVANSTPAASQIRLLAAGDVAVIRGMPDPSSGVMGLKHRSPPIK